MMTDIMKYLRQAVEGKASDLFIVAGCPVSLKKDGEISPADEIKLLPPQTERLISDLYELADRSMENYLQMQHDNFSFAVPGLARFRVGAYRQRGSMAAVVRVVTFDIPDWESLHIPKTVMDLANLTHGMILITGATGSGKSTTQACMIDQINRTRNCHIVTLEEPIEFLHRNQRSVVSQQEVGLDVEDRLSALKLSVWQAPDVIVLDRMEEWTIMQAAVSAAQTGRLLIATLPTKGVVDAVNYMINSFPADQRTQARLQLSRVLRAVVSQQLLPGKEGGLFPVFELVRVNGTIQDLIRTGQENEIEESLTGVNRAITMDQSILELYRAEKISVETALSYATNPEQMRRRCV